MTWDVFSVYKEYLDFIRAARLLNKPHGKTKQITMTILAICLQAMLSEME